MHLSTKPGVMYFFHVLLRIAMWVQQWGREGWKCRVRKPISQLMKTPMHSHSLCTISYCLVQVYCNDVLNRNYLNFPASSVVHRRACYCIRFYCNGRFYSFRTKKQNTSSHAIKYLAFSLGPHTNINLLGCNACVAIFMGQPSTWKQQTVAFWGVCLWDQCASGTISKTSWIHSCTLNS